MFTAKNCRSHGSCVHHRCVLCVMGICDSIFSASLQAELGSSEGVWKRCGWQNNSPDHISWRCNPENGAVWEGFPVCSGGIQMAGFQVAEVHCLQGESGKSTGSWHWGGHLMRNGGQMLYPNHMCHVLLWGGFLSVPSQVYIHGLWF